MTPATATSFVPQGSSPAPPVVVSLADQADAKTYDFRRVS